MTSGEGFQEGSIQQNPTWSCEHSKPVLVAVEVDPGLNTDRGIDVSHQRRGHLDVRYAAAVTAGDKTDDIRQDSPPNCDDRLVSPVYGKGIQFLRDGKIAFHGFEVLAAGEGNDFGIDQVLRKIIPDLCAEYPFDIGIHHDEPAGIFDFTLRQQGRVLRVEKVEGV